MFEKTIAYKDYKIEVNSSDVLPVYYLDNQTKDLKVTITKRIFFTTSRKFYNPFKLIRTTKERYLYTLSTMETNRDKDSWKYCGLLPDGCILVKGN